MKSDIILAGVGGQGILTIATILGASALRDNLYLKQAEVHGMSQRGGDVQSNLRISSNPIHSDLIPTGGADLIVSLEPMEALRYKSQLNPEGWLITNTNPFVNIDNYPDMDKVVEELGNMNNVIAFDMDEIAKEIHSPRSSNMILLGAASAFIDIKAEEIEKGIAEFFGKKGESVVNTNIEAFRVGREKAENMR